MPTYSYANCLANAYKVNWRIEDVLGARRFDPARSWLPSALSGASAIACLDEAERRALTHVELAAYAHLFGYVEEFIAPKVSALARDFEIEQRVAFDALTNFAAEEVKHMNLFRAVRERVDGALGFELERLGGEAATARFVLGKSTGAVMLFTAAIEWLTLRHFVEAFKDAGDLDPLTQAIFKAHWQEESQHAQLDHLETVRAFNSMTAAERERAIDELIELVAAVDGLLRQQTEHDLANLSRLLVRAFDPLEAEELRREVLRAKRWTFILSGVTHPRFQELFEEVATPAQRERVGAALEGLLRGPLQAAA
jgi:hypothetical protein